MEFPYYKVIDFPKHQQRSRFLPWIYIGIFNPKDESNVVYPLGLIDSGSELTIINREFGEELEFDIEKGKYQEIVGIGGGRIVGYLHEIGFKIEDLKKEEEAIVYKDLAIFTDSDFPKSMPQQTAIFGTVGFFRKLAVGLDFPNCILIETKESVR